MEMGENCQRLKEEILEIEVNHKINVRTGIFV